MKRQFVAIVTCVTDATNTMRYRWATAEERRENLAYMVTGIDPASPMPRIIRAFRRVGFRVTLVDPRPPRRSLDRDLDARLHMRIAGSRSDRDLRSALADACRHGMAF